MKIDKVSEYSRSIIQMITRNGLKVQLASFKLIAVLTLLHLAYSRVSETTTYDGITTTQLYNSYVRFNGNTGLQLSEAFTQPMTSYTFSLWFRHQKTPAELDRIVDIVRLSPDAFNCQFSKRQAFICNSNSGGNYELNAASMLPQNWYILVLRAQSGSSSLQLREQSFRVFAQDSTNRFFPFNQGELKFQTILLGIDPDLRSSGIVGSIRNLKLLSGFYDESVVQRIQYFYLYPLKYLRLQLLLNDLNDYANTAGQATAQLVGNDRNPSRQIDYLGVFWCWAPSSTQLSTYYQDFVAFSTNFALTDIFTSQNIYQSSLQMWLYRRYTTSGVSTEIVFQHNDLLRLTFARSDYSYLQIVNLNQPSQVIKVPVPFQRWFFIQVINALSSLTVTLFEQDGQQLFNQAVTFSTPVSQSGNVINIGQNFQGYIQGIKYYKSTTPSPNSIHAFKNTQDSNSDLMNFYIFTPSSQSSNRFTNFAQNGQNPAQVNSGSVTTNKLFYREYGTTDTLGTVDQALNYDGYTCIDNKEKLYFQNTQSQVSLKFTNTQLVNQYTFEFWFRTTQSSSNDAYMLALEDRSQKLLTVIKQDIDYTLSCYSAFTVNPKSSLLYLDYNKDAGSWMHISCIYDGSQMQLRGLLYYSEQNYAYFSDLTQAVSLSNNQDYTVYLNTDPRSDTRGQQRAFYQDLRFWKSARTLNQVSSARFHQLDLDYAKDQLLSYIKLTSGATINNVIMEYDYQEAPSFVRQIQTKGTVQWQSNSEIVVCPVGMYKAEKEQKCYREGTLNFLLIIYKTRTSYVITPTFSTFRNSYLREFASQLFDFSWTLDVLSPNNASNQAIFPSIFASQQTRQNLEFQFTQVSDTRAGRYDFSVVMNDKRRMQNTQKATITLKTMFCANIFDRETQTSIVNRDMDNIKGTDDAVFTYGVSECADYVFDYGSLQIVLEAPGGLILTNLEHNIQAKTVTLRSYNQPNIPLNEQFFVRLKGLWRNPQNFGDTIEYSLIYICRYTSKLVITLQPNLRTLLKGQTLSIDYKADFFNIKNTQKDRSYSVKWQCPGALNTYCQQQTGALKINYDQITNTGLDFWKAQTITLIAQTNFIQGDGSRFSNKSVDIVWLNVNPDARIFSNTRFLNKQSNLSYQLDINSLKEEVVQIQWDVSPTLDKSCFINSNNRKQVVINSKCLSEGQTYTLIARIIYNQQQQQIWTSTGQIQVPRSPWGDGLSCNTTTGKAFIDPIRCTANGWNVQNSPIRFQFFAKDLKTGNLLPVSPISGSNEFTGYYPPTQQIVVRVTDGSEGYNQAQINANIQVQADQVVQRRVIDILNSAYYTKDLSNTLMISEFQWISGALSTYPSLFPDQTLFIQTLLNFTLYQAKKLDQFGSTDLRRSFLYQATLSFIHLTSTNNLQVKDLNMIQEIVSEMTQKSQDALNSLLLDKDFHANFFQLQSNILLQLQKIQSKTTEWQLAKTNQTAMLSNITLQMRRILTAYELFISLRLYEGEEFYVNSTQLTFYVQKYSRMGSVLTTKNFTSPSLNLSFPLASAKEPTFRQTFTMLTFKINPFLGSNYLNQSATSQNAVYFSYRDENGKYLDSSNILEKIKMTFRYEYSPFIFLPNVTVCGHIGTEDAYWENRSCETTFNREQGIVTCSCKHMSYYSVIEDYLMRPQRIPLINLTFKNWASFIVFMYILMFFIIGLIYTFNKDNQDFRFLHLHEEAQGNTLLSEDAVSLVSLAFKRKVFFMGYATNQYSFCTLFRLFFMLLHPIFQLKYRLDPQIPRFSRFIVLFTRVVLMFALSFFILKDYKNFNDPSLEPSAYAQQVAALVFFLIVGSLVFLPLPIVVMNCFRSRYYLIDQKAKQNQDFDRQEANGVDNGEDDYYDGITNICLDMSLPIKLLFLINAVSHEKLQKEINDKLAYGMGDLAAVGTKLYELDVDIQQELEDKQDLKNGSKDETQHTNMELIAGGGGQERSNRGLISAREVTHESGGDQTMIANTSNKNMLSITPAQLQRAQNNNSKIDDENLGDIEEESPDQQKRLANDRMFEGGEPQNEQQQENQDDEEGSDMSIATELFLDEKKELIEEKNYFGRFFGYGLAFIFNLGLIIAVLSVYVRDGYYNQINPYIWVIAFFGTQIIAFLIIDTLAILIFALIVSKWCKKNKIFLARFFRECLYIYEDYRYVVQFAQTKIS